MNFTYYHDGKVRVVSINQLFLQSKVLRCLPLEDEAALRSALWNGYGGRSQYEFGIGDSLSHTMRKMDFYELSLLPNLEVIWAYYQMNKTDLDEQATLWWDKRRELHRKHVRRSKKITTPL